MAGELLGTGFIEIKPRLDAFKAELNQKARKSLKDGVEKPAEQAEKAVEDLIDAAKKVAGTPKPTQFEEVGDDIKSAAKQANLFNDELEDIKTTAKQVGNVDIDDNIRMAKEVASQLPLAFEETTTQAKKATKEVSAIEAAVRKSVLQSKLLATAQEVARKEADRLELSAVEQTAAIKEAVVQAKRMGNEIEKSTNSSQEFERAIERATRAVKQNDKAWEEITDEVLESARANKKFLEGIEKTKSEARELQERMAKVAQETDEVGDEAARAESKIRGATSETRQWEGAARGVRSAVAGIVAGLGAREIFQGLKEATTAAIDFEGGLNEVFTLIPGVNDQLRNTLGEGVREVAREFGQLPEDAVPALYNALSAGVPPDNVLTFLETASKLAVGGVTDLNSGVNILTTAVNSYNSVLDENGNQYLDAALASDILFTTVRLGKTNIDQLNASLGQVLPTAAATGLKFEDVGAALAVLTANGLNTPRATTALNASLVELNKEGTRAFNLFEQASGQTFPEFIEQGGQLNEGLRLLQEEAEATGTSILDVFPVEAARGALALTNNIDSLDAATAQFNDTSGATDAAFAEVFEGDAFAVQQATAAFEDLKIELGQKLLPTVAAVAREFVDLYKGFLEGGFDGFLDRLREIAPATAGAIEKLAEVAKAVRDFFASLTGNDFLGSIFGENFTLVDGIIAALVTGAGLIGTAIIGFVGPVILGAFGTVFSGLIAPFAGAVVGFGSLFTGIGGTIIGAFGGVGGFIATLTSGFGALATTIGSKGLLGTLRGLIPSFSTLLSVGARILTFFNPLVLIGGLLVGAFVKLTATNEGFRQSLAGLLPPIIAIGETIAGVVIPVFEQISDAVLNDVLPAFEPVVEVIVADLLPAILSLVDVLIAELLPIFLGGLVFAFTTVLPLIAQVAAFILELLVPAVAAIVVWVAENLIPAIADLVGWFKENLVPTIVEVATWIGENLVPAFLGLATVFIDDVIPAISDLWTWLSESLFPAAQDVSGEINDTLNPAFQAIATFIREDVVPAVQELYQWWQANILPIIQTVASFISTTLIPALGSLGEWIRTEVVPALQLFWSWFSENILPILQTVASFIGGELVSQLGTLASVVGTVLVVAFRAWWLIMSNVILPILGVLIGIIKGGLISSFNAATTVINIGTSAFNGLRSAIQFVIDKIGSLISKVSDLKNSGIGAAISGIAGAVGGAAGAVLLAEGGIVNRATNAIIGEDGPEVVLPLGEGRRDRLFELAKASGLTDIILNNVQQIEATPDNPSNTELTGLSRAISSPSGPVIGGSQDAPRGPSDGPGAMTTVNNNFAFEAQGVSMEEVLNESAQIAAAEFRSAKVGC